jgi:aminoglycoside phosphotransferase (APT) family kinase protein
MPSPIVCRNYGFGNVMVHEGRITGVLDWLDAKYEDKGITVCFFCSN